MNWLYFAFISLVAFSVADLFGKMSSDKLHPYIGAFLINFSSAFFLLIPILYFYFKGEQLFSFKSNGLTLALIAGLMISIASLFLFKTFAAGANLSISVPLVRTGMVVVGTILGILVLKEGLSTRLIFGLLFSLIGIYLISTAK